MIIRAVGLPADIQRAEGSLEWWQELWKWAIASDALWWAIIGLLAAGMVALQIAPMLPGWLAGLWHNKERYARLIEEHDNLYKKRTDYWNLAKTKYQKWQHANGYEGLENLIEKAKFPNVVDGLDTVHTWSRSLTGFSKGLWDFCQWSFSQDEKDFEFRDLQTVLSGHWQIIGGAVFDEKEISRAKIFDRHFPHQSRLVKLLAYYECVLEIQLNSRKIRKPYLFKVYKAAQRLGLTYEGNQGD